MRVELRRGARRPDPRSLTLFVLVPLLVLVAVAAGTALLSERLARRNAIADAEHIAVGLTRYLVAPVLEEAIDGQPGKWEELAKRVHDRLADKSITELNIWTAQGMVRFSSNRAISGHTFPTTTELRSALAGRVVSDVDDGEVPDYPDGPAGHVVEVYVPVRINDQTLVVETYFGQASIQREAALLRGRIIPVALGGLIVLQLVQEPIGLSLLRRVRRQDAERAALLARSLTASERERHAIAADVHDGPVQDLAGVGYALAALKPSVPAEAHAEVDRLSGEVRDMVAGLRRLMADLYPPEPTDPVMPAAVEEIADAARAGGLAVTVDAQPIPELNSRAAAILQRTARDALAEAARDPGTTSARVAYGPADIAGVPAVRLRVNTEDDGRPDARRGWRIVGRRRGRAVDREGLAQLGRHVAELGGSLTIDARTARGFSVTAVVPAASPPPDEGVAAPSAGGGPPVPLAERLP
jgi:signal transduction histidine kinase